MNLIDECGLRENQSQDLRIPLLLTYSRVDSFLLVCIFRFYDLFLYIHFQSNLSFIFLKSIVL